ncbi:MAG: DNA polymerase IV, partial [Microthrixaceae bacterium]|nr:DNA polymerase IV [Microthrixaceae bacterium]
MESTVPATHRRIFHIDMDAFFASVELLRHPELVGLPVVVGGTGSRGVVAAASYEARAFGVYSAMPSSRARNMCPQAVFLNGDHAHYRSVSEQIMGIFARWTPLVEPLSLDEAFLDMTGTRRTFSDPVELALRVRQQVLDETSLHCSIGVARNKFLAKLATNEAKPKATPKGPLRGTSVFVLRPDDEEEFLRSLPIKRLWGVGPATLGKLRPLGIATVGDLRDMNPDLLANALGHGPARRLSELARGIDERPVEPDSEPRSVSQEETFASDVFDRDELHRHVVGQADSVAYRLRSHGLRARTVHLKLRYGTFETLTRSRTLDRATD